MELPIYQNINDTIFLSMLNNRPYTIKRMKYLIKSHNGIKLLESKWDIVCQNTKMSKLQLDALFILIRYLHHTYDIIKNEIVKTAKDNMVIFQNTPEDFTKLSNNEDFYQEMVDDTMFDINDKTTSESFFCTFLTTMDLILKYSPYLKPYDDKDMNWYFEQHILQYFENNDELLKNYVQKLYEKISDKLSTIKKNSIKILDICAKEVITDDEKKYLNSLIGLGVNLKINYSKDQALEYYYDMVIDEFDSEDTEPKPNHPNTYWYTSNSQNSVKLQNQKLSQIGYEIVCLENSNWFHGLIDCFVEQGFADSKTIITNILYILYNERDSIGYTNKYDTLTLYDHYILITIANDINLSFDQSIQQILESSRIPIEFPTELTMRILSRLYNVKITFYLENLSCIELDNCISDNPKQMTIYQFHLDFYYNIIPCGNIFCPFYQRKNIDHNINKLEHQVPTFKTFSKKIENDLNDIVEI